MESGANGKWRRDKRGGARQQGGKPSGPVASLQGGCSTARYWRCAAMRARQPWMLQEHMPYERTEGAFCGTIGQQTLDAQQRLLLHLAPSGRREPIHCSQ